ncbi:ABC transporter ATP-binding protein [Paracoccus versutus]|uniref:Amino acid/amide ABC transporter ATP-binding protein 2 (HAAT family) n=1 Tax=Paracoccus versutus TaxID=34007 RepID=A0A369TW33_PARVE|nr:MULTISPECIES: ABC transporter ATP-binding protein [Paracoccus]WGR60568.1 ABC transporter ATP-binding protein [Paracoccus ferrooxidans]SFX96349.1 urea transport system ATP-binding protein [Paracoccus pantotrophus]MBT0780321.1 ABC transporter ATP-binding protein [Paracoccus sp. pheM1]RDD68387.1 ABC transporter ATP-binding protein [Paracoccus versutus]REF69481.1 amino acid/amide ABC transporter ATP-binding protein 2 (HAAT family) [Paracoccus versutus]
MLQLVGVHSGYGQIPILRDISLNVAEGEFVGILGHNGMGKSTLLMTIGGTLPATDGRIEMGGQDITRLPVHRRARMGLGYVKQGRRIFPRLTVRENMQAACLAGGQPLARAEEMIALFPRLAPIAERPGGVLSGGEQQILALARCLCTAPRLVMLDEPTEGIQPSIREEIVEALLMLRDRLRLTMLLVEQNEAFLGALCTRSYCLEKGRLVA